MFFCTIDVNVAEYYASKEDYGRAGDNYLKAQMYTEALQFYMQAGSTCIEKAIQVVCSCQRCSFSNLFASLS